VTWFILTRKERKEKELTTPLTLVLSRRGRGKLGVERS